MVFITNNTNTLNGALMELAETIADNLTTKGVTASPNDGLTSLANKVLQISGGGSTTIFEDDFTSATNNWVKQGSGGTLTRGNGTLSWNYSNGSGKHNCCYYNQRVTGDFKITATFSNGNYDTIVLGIDPSDNYKRLGIQPKWGYDLYINETPSNSVRLYGTYNYPVTLVIEREDTTVRCYIDGTLLTEFTWTACSLDGYIGIDQCENRTTTCTSFKVESLGGGGNCYNVKFTENSEDESCGGVAILEVFARYQYQPLANTSLTVTGSDNSTYTATTDSDGLAIFTVNVSADTTYTCTYQGSTDTFSVEKSPYLFFDDCTRSAKLSKYGSPVSIYNASFRGSPVMEYDSTENAYALYGTSTNDYAIFPIPLLDGKSNFTFSCELKLNNSSSYPYIGLGVMPNESQLTSTYAEMAYIYRYSASQVYAYAQRRRRTTSSSITSGRITHTPTNWLKLKLVFNSTTSFTATWEELDGTVLKTYGVSVTASISDRHYGVYLRGSGSYKGWIRNIKAEANE